MRQVLLDTFGADLGTAELIKGAVMALRSRDDFEFVLFGNEDEIKAVLSEENYDGSRITIVNATDFITNEDNPMSVFRGRENSSMVLALNYLKTNENAHGLLSAGSTGALMVGSIAHVGIKKGLSTPVLGSLIPNPFTSWKLLVDCGAHLTPTAADLVTFARLGAKYYAATFNNSNPTIGLLSVGSEPGKGTELVKEAYKLLDESDLNFVGNVEGSDLHFGRADVVVTDGFTGNVLLKSIEESTLTATKMVENYMSKEKLDEMTMHVFERLVDQMHEVFDMTTRGGATFLGTNKLIVKMHGSSTRETVVACVDQILKTDISALC